MSETLHITSGDTAGLLLEASGLPGEVLVWRDVLYDGRRQPGWPDPAGLEQRARFLSELTGGGLPPGEILKTLIHQYDRLKGAGAYGRIVLWFDACLFDQSMLAHLLGCLRTVSIENLELICVDAFQGITRFNGLGQLNASQLASLWNQRQPVREAQTRYAVDADRAFASGDSGHLTNLAHDEQAPLPHVPAAARRRLLEEPDPETGLGRLEALALDAICSGCTRPDEIFRFAAAAETPPQFWGDTTLWAKINRLADQEPPLVSIDGPAGRLPQWESALALSDFTIVRSS